MCEVNLLCLFQEANLEPSLGQLESLSSGRSLIRMNSWVIIPDSFKVHHFHLPKSKMQELLMPYQGL